ncbi:MAG: hypothetical protein OES70_07870, partial [Desulfobacterales bacterium]|nr:hypothetical protein [Desulfobacterales bacterium]
DAPQLINRIVLFIYLPDLASAIGIFKQFVNKTFQTRVYNVELPGTHAPGLTQDWQNLMLDTVITSL